MYGGVRARPDCFAPEKEKAAPNCMTIYSFYLDSGLRLPSPNLNYYDCVQIINYSSATGYKSRELILTNLRINCGSNNIGTTISTSVSESKPLIESTFSVVVVQPMPVHASA